MVLALIARHALPNPRSGPRKLAGAMAFSVALAAVVAGTKSSSADTALELRDMAGRSVATGLPSCVTIMAFWRADCAPCL
jgi:hypothetical protein